MDLARFMAITICGIPMLAFFIFFARIVDVSIGTLRIIFLSRGMKYVPPILGFFEVLVWLTVVSQVVRNVTTPILLFAYAGGYATGNFIGILLERRLRLGSVILRIITRKDAARLIELLRESQLGVTKVKAESNGGDVHIIFMVVHRKNLKDILAIVKELHPRALITVEDVREAHNMRPPIQINRIPIGPIH